MADTTLQERKMMTETMGEEERWSQGLPDDILQSIAQRLHISEYQVFRQVCPFWGAAVDRGIAIRSCPPVPQLPWLLLHDSYGFRSGPDRDSVDAFSIEHQYSLLRSPISFRTEILPDSCTRYCVGSVESWLIVAVLQRFGDKKYRRTVDNFFVNPLSRARVVKLPSDNLTLKKTVASSPPTATTRMQQIYCFVATLGKRNGLFQLGICRPTDTFWTLIELIDGINYTDIEIIDQKLYVAGFTDAGFYLLEYDMLSEDDNVTRVKYNFGLCMDLVGMRDSNPCLVKDSATKELFVIIHSSKISNGVRVYKMEGNKNSDAVPSCEEVTDLGDRILFLSERSNKVIYDNTLGKNCIYFAYSSSFINDGFWVYSLTDMSFKRVNFPKDYLLPPRAWTIWFTPHPW